LSATAGQGKKSPEQISRVLLAETRGELNSLLQDLPRDLEVALAEARDGKSMREVLISAMRYAVKQYMLAAELRHLALTDELTGLYNRRGFLALAARQLKLSRRSGCRILLLLMDMDGLKNINDTFGHSEGDLALARAADAMKKTFRDSDVLARLGGDEFAALAIEASGHNEPCIAARLEENLAAIGGQERRYALSFSLGSTRFHPQSPATIGQLIKEADQAMYRQKQQRRWRPGEPAARQDWSRQGNSVAPDTARGYGNTGQREPCANPGADPDADPFGQAVTPEGALP